MPLNQQRKGILIISFGTSYHETRKKTIDQIEEDIARAYPDYKLYHAWTSKMIIQKLLKRDNIIIHTVSEEMQRIVEDGITHLTVQPTHILNGVENDIMKEEVLAFKEQFSEISFGDPLLTTEKDNARVIQAIMKEYSHLKKEEALVLMGHGTPHYSNPVYAALDYTFKDMGFDNVFVGTVEAYPSIETVLKLVNTYKPKKVFLAPFMLVAGDHAVNDLAGEEEDSWKTIFENEGYETHCLLQGLGELESIRRIYLEHLKQAVF